MPKNLNQGAYEKKLPLFETLRYHGAPQIALLLPPDFVVFANAYMQQIRGNIAAFLHSFSRMRAAPPHGVHRHQYPEPPQATVQRPHVLDPPLVELKLLREAKYHPPLPPGETHVTNGMTSPPLPTKA